MIVSFDYPRCVLFVRCAFFCQVVLFVKIRCCWPWGVPASSSLPIENVRKTRRCMQMAWCDHDFFVPDQHPKPCVSMGETMPQIQKTWKRSSQTKNPWSVMQFSLLGVTRIGDAVFDILETAYRKLFLYVCLHGCRRISYLRWYVVCSTIQAVLFL